MNVRTSRGWFSRLGIRDLVWLVVVVFVSVAWWKDHQKHVLPAPLSAQEIRLIAENELAKRYPSPSRNLGLVIISPPKADMNFYMVEINSRSDPTGAQFQVRVSETGQVEEIVVSKESREREPRRPELRE